MDASVLDLIFALSTHSAMNSHKPRSRLACSDVCNTCMLM